MSKNTLIAIMRFSRILDNKAYDTIPQTSTNSGLNACLDHRGEVYVPELSKTFTIGRDRNKTRFIACMNPVEQGGGRKGLPKSFLNRFVKVGMLELPNSNFPITVMIILLSY